MAPVTDPRVAELLGALTDEILRNLGYAPTEGNGEAHVRTMLGPGVRVAEAGLTGAPRRQGGDGGDATTILLAHVLLVMFTPQIQAVPSVTVDLLCGEPDRLAAGLADRLGTRLDTLGVDRDGFDAAVRAACARLLTDAAGR